MAELIRKLDDFVDSSTGLFKDNTAGDISAQDLRDFVVSVMYGLHGYIDGLILANNGTDADHDVDIAAGVAWDNGTDVLLRLASSLTKRIDSSWAVGTNQGGLDGTESVAGTPDANTWYHVWLIRRSDTGVVDALFSESATSPTMPTNYDQKRRIGAVLTNASANILAFKQTGDLFLWVAPVLDVNSGTLSTTGALVSLTVPTGIKVKARFIFLTNATGSICLHDPVLGTGLDSANVADRAYMSGVAAANGPIFEVTTDTAGRIRQEASAANSYWIGTSGWTDPRGRNS